MLAPDNITSVEELQALAESQLEIESDFLESLPTQAAQEAMETEGVLTSLTLLPSTVEVAIGDVASAQLTGRLSDGTSVDPAALASAVWTVEDPTIAEITAANTILGLKAGRTTVSVSVGDIEARLSLSVLPLDVAAETTTTRRQSTTSSSTSSTESTTSTSTTSTTSSSSSSSTSSTLGEATLTMSVLDVLVHSDGSFRLSFTTNLCTSANYQGAGQPYSSPGWPLATSCTENHVRQYSTVEPGSYPITVQVRSAGGQQAERSTTVVIEDKTTTTTEPVEPNLTMSPLGVQVNDDGSFKITFNTNLCTIASYQGAGQSYQTPGWPDVIGPCWESHGQNFSSVPPGSYEITVRSRSEGGQQRSRTTTVVIPEP